MTKPFTIAEPVPRPLSRAETAKKYGLTKPDQRRIEKWVRVQIEKERRRQRW